VKIKSAIIGCGKIGFKFDANIYTNSALTHFSALKSHKDFELVAVADIDSSVINHIASSNSIETYNNHIELLENHTPDVVTISSPDDTHYNIAMDVLNYKPKLVFIEKPLAKNLEKTNEIVNRCNSSNILLMVNYSRRFFEPFHSWRKLILKGELNIKQITCHYTGGLVHNGIHFLDLVFFLLGAPEKVNVFSGYNHESPSFKLIYKQIHLIIHFIGLEDLSNSVEELDIFHQMGRFKIDNHGIKTYDIIDDPIYPGFSIYGNKEKVNDDSKNALLHAYQNISDKLNYDESLISPGEDSVKTMEIIQHIKGDNSCLN
jgi:predicted dehydrogenase